MTKETITNYCKEYLAISAEMKKLQARQEVLKQRILDSITIENTPTSYKVTIKDIAPTTIFDSALFRKTYPDMYNSFRTKEKAGYKSINIIKL